MHIISHFIEQIFLFPITDEQTDQASWTQFRSATDCFLGEKRSHWQAQIECGQGHKGGEGMADAGNDEKLGWLKNNEEANAWR